MGTTTTTFTLTVQAAEVTKAEQIAAAMALARPSAPMWSSELTDDPDLQYIARTTIDQNVGNTGGMTGAQLPAWNAPTAGGVDLLAWTGKAHEYNGKWHYIAGTSGQVPHSCAVVRYDPVTDEFRHWTGSAVGSADAPFHPHGFAHNFQSAALDPVSGKIYKHMSVNVGTAGPNLGVWDTTTNLGTRLAGDPGDGGVVFPAYAIHPTMGAAGTLIAFYQAGTRVLRRFDLLSQEWIAPTSWSVAMPEAVCPVAHAGYLYFTAGDGNFWRLEPDGSAPVARASTPVQMNSAGNDAKHTIMVSLGSYIYALKVGDGVYRYDPTLNEWSGLYDQWPFTVGTTEGLAFTAGPLGNSVLVVRSVGGTGSQRLAYLWKP